MDIAVPWFRKHGNVLPMIALDKYPPEFAQAYQKTKDYISSASKICGANHIPMVLLVIPAGVQVDKADWEFMGIQQLYTDKLFNENMVRANSEFADFAKEQRIPCLDLLPTFRQTTTRPLFLPKDGHFTRQGSELTAQTLFSYLTTEKLILIAPDSKK